MGGAFRTTDTIGPLAPGDFAGLSGKVAAGLMLRLGLTALYVSLKLVPQHRFYLSEFCIAKLALLIHFLEVRQQLVCGLSASNGLIAQFSHDQEPHGRQHGQNKQPERQLPGRGREKLKDIRHAATRSRQVSVFRPLFLLCTLAGGGLVFALG